MIFLAQDPEPIAQNFRSVVGVLTLGVGNRLIKVFIVEGSRIDLGSNSRYAIFWSV